MDSNSKLNDGSGCERGGGGGNGAAGQIVRNKADSIDLEIATNTYFSGPSC